MARGSATAAGHSHGGNGEHSGSHSHTCERRKKGRRGGPCSRAPLPSFHAQMDAEPEPPPSFQMQLLPEAARDLIFNLLRRDEAARACCVCAAWRRAFSAPHLWAALTFDQASFGYLTVSRDVVRGAAAKAGAALRSLSLPSHCLGLVSALAAAHPGLACVRLADPFHLRWHICLPQAKQLRAAAAAVRELHLGLIIEEDFFFSAAASTALELLRLPSLRVAHFSVGGYGGHNLSLQPLLQPLAAVLRAHAHTLRELHVIASCARAPAGADGDDFADALAGCSKLESLRLTHLFDAAAFEGVARTVSRGCCALRAMRLDSDDIAFYAAGVAAHLLPSLTALELSSLRGGDAASVGLRVLAAALVGNATLQRVRLATTYEDVHLSGIAAARATAPGVKELELLSLRPRLLQQFALGGLLPPALERLTMDGIPMHCSNDMPEASKAVRLLRAASGAPRLAWLSLEVPSTCAVHTSELCALLHTMPALHELRLRYGYCFSRSLGQHDEERSTDHSSHLGDALRACTTLQTLHLSVSFETLDVASAIAARALSGNGSLRELRIELDCGVCFRGPGANEKVGVALEHLAAAVHTAHGLRVLHIVTRTHGSYTKETTLWALFAAARATLAATPRAVSGALDVQVITRKS